MRADHFLHCIVTAQALLTAVCLLMLASLVACKPSKTEKEVKSTPPATVAKYVTEEELALVTLAPEAEKRLGIATAPVESKPVERTRTFGGELMVALGHSTNAAKSVPETNATSQGRSIYSLLPSLTSTELVRVAEMQIIADGEIEAAKVQLEGAKITLTRAENLLTNKAGSLRAVDDAKGQVKLAQSALQTAQAKRDLLGAPLFDAVKRDILWLRVPVYVGALQELKTDAEARVGHLGDPPGAATRGAKPIFTSLSGAPTSASVDLLFEVENKDNMFRAGEKVGVNIPLKGEQQSQVVPWAAVVHDINGGTWVYEKTGPQTYARRRVQVRHVTAGLAVLASGPKVGASIVTEGAAELFGTELGFGK